MEKPNTTQPTIPTMPPPIRELPRSLVERIAAGEVIERPASVVRELIDNALDAGATEIRIELRDGGMRLIRVSDDGWGIRSDELALACQPHTTSKIAQMDDLACLATLGFRGEALASIGAVAELTLTSACDKSGMAREITLRPGAPDEVITEANVARGRGTTVTVRHLFQTMPARRALLRGPAAEATRALAVVRAYAVARPAVRFTLTHDGDLLLQTPGADLPSTIEALYGADVANSLSALEPVHLTNATISGYVAGRSFHFPTREHIFLSVNGRPLATRALLAAAEAGYRPLLRKGRHPLLNARITVDPDRIDVNIHPAKAEALLRDEASLAAALRQAIHQALGAAPLSFAVAASPGTRAGAMLSQARQLRLPMPRRRRLARLPSFSEAGARQLAWATTEETPLHELPELEPLAQFANTLILAQSPEGHLFLVDQHRAHERVLYERIKQTPQESQPGDQDEVSAAGAGQLLLEPLMIELTPMQAEILTARLDELASLGLECQPFGGSVFLVRALPHVPGAAHDVAAFVRELAQDAAIESDDWRDHVTIALACRGAIRRGQPLSLPEQRALLADLRSAGVASVCPHGSPLAIYYSQEVFIRLFGW